MQRKVEHKFATFPEALLLHLKRFELGKKLETRCEFQKRMVIPAKLSASGRAETYSLKTIIMHEGSVTSGHYIAFALKDGQWLELNDEKVSKVRVLLQCNSAKCITAS